MGVVYIPSALAKFTEGERFILLEGGYLDEVLRGLGDRYPNLQSAVFDDRGDLKPHIRVFVKDRCIENWSHERVAVGEGDEVVLISAIAGG